MMQIEELQTQLQAMKLKAFTEMKEAQQYQSLYDVKVRYWGKTGELTSLLRQTGQLSPEQRPSWGQFVNQVKAQLEEEFESLSALLKKREIEEKMASEELDLTLPGPGFQRGSVHVLSQVTEHTVEILSRLGYSLRLGPVVESDFYNFEALNIPKNHPARDMQDTFFVSQNQVLRTHTSPIQIHTLEAESLPLRILGSGGVFRCDSDISHLPHFHQIEGLCVDEAVSMSDLKGTIRFFIREFFGRDLKIRFRPSYFPFTEPSAEVDCECPLCTGKGCSVCKHTGWIEVGGCGLVHPKVFESVSIDPSRWQGFAFGFGMERMAMIRHRIGDIRLFPEGDLRFVTQFQDSKGSF
jgi:phenylalanyl-tRNA synthetase alpha chain